MGQVVIENPILNSPFGEPERHFRFTDEGITDEIAEGRRESGYFVPIPRPRGKRKGETPDLFETSYTADRWQPCQIINKIRPKIALWRKGGYSGVTRMTQRLLEHWNNPERERKLFFCQIEALETAIYITEVARRYGDAWIENDLREVNQDANPELYRIAFKMATGSGKTFVMAMLIAWQALNKLANPQDARFSDAFLIVTPGITIRDRLRVLLPNDPENYYKERDIVPLTLRDDLEKAKIVITNFHSFKQREKVAAGKLTKSILNGRGVESNAFTESPAEMVRRVCRDLGNKKNPIILNDEAHHCYRRKPDVDDEGEKLKGEERREAEARNEEARIWISGIEAVKHKLGVRAVYDLSATPFFLRGSGYNEGTLFPWVVSDFSLIDAIEAGIVKVPRVPVADDADPGGSPTYRDLWYRIRESLPRKGRKTEAVTGDPNLPAELQGALHGLYTHYEKSFRSWKTNAEAVARGATPPVFIVVCNNTNVSKLVFEWMAGWKREIDGQSIAQAGNLELFRNDDGRGGWLARPNTILIDSGQLESGESMSAEFKKIAEIEIEEFKHDLRLRFPGRAVDELTDEDLLREVMNTVGKPRKLGEQVRCVVSVSMLTEGWDANSVTHILGVRAFGTQLLCEQVVGRGLRRMSYDAVPRKIEYNGKSVEILAFEPEYAEVYGVPFSFIPCSGATANPKPGPSLTRVRAMEDRAACEITFPRVLGYRWDFAGERLEAKFNGTSGLSLSTQDIPSWPEVAPIVGETEMHRPEDLKRRREQEVVFRLARLVLEKYFRDAEGNPRLWLFPQLVGIARRWMTECVRLKDNAFPQMLLLAEIAETASDKIYRGIIEATDTERRLLPILAPYDTVGSTRYVEFDTARPVYRTREDKCHLNYVVCDTDSWEQKVAQSLEEMPEVRCYVKNHNLGFTIPYTLGGEERQYIPDFIARIDGGGAEPLNLIIEVTGEKKRDKEAKVETAKTLWVPAVSNHGEYGKWAVLEITDSMEVYGSVRKLIRSLTSPMEGRVERD